MMVMDLYAYSTLSAMERPWWSQKITSGTIAQFILLFLRINVACSVVYIFIVDHRKVLEFTQIVELINWICDAHMFEIQFQLLLSLIFNMIFSDAAGLLILIIWNFRIHLNARQDSRFCG
jgi:hypothetical protein